MASIYKRCKLASYDYNELFNTRTVYVNSQLENMTITGDEAIESHIKSISNVENGSTDVTGDFNDDFLIVSAVGNSSTNNMPHISYEEI